MFIGESVQMLKDTENLKIHRYDENVGKYIYCIHLSISFYIYFKSSQSRDLTCEPAGTSTFSTSNCLTVIHSCFREFTEGQRK